MRNLICLILFVGSIAHAKAPCGVDEFMTKLCVSEEPSNLSGNEVGHMKCVDPASVPHIVQQVRQAFLRAPSWLQTRFCDLGGIGVYPTMPETPALSWSFYDTQYIGLQRQRIEPGYSLSHHETVMRKHSLNKKKLPEGVSFPDNFGFQHTGDDSGLGVLYLMAHEMGHLIYNAPLPPGEYGLFGRCTILADQRACRNFIDGEWGFFSWVTAAGPIGRIDYGLPRPENRELTEYVLSTNTSTKTLEEQDAFFDRLFKSPFVTAFAARSPEEDFCDTVAFKVVADALESWNFQRLDGTKIDVRGRMQKANNPVLQKKLDFLETNF